MKPRNDFRERCCSTRELEGEHVLDAEVDGCQAPLRISQRDRIDQILEGQGSRVPASAHRDDATGRGMPIGHQLRERDEIEAAEIRLNEMRSCLGSSREIAY